MIGSGAPSGAGPLVWRRPGARSTPTATAATSSQRVGSLRATCHLTQLPEVDAVDPLLHPVVVASVVDEVVDPPRCGRLEHRADPGASSTNIATY